MDPDEAGTISGSPRDPPSGAGGRGEAAFQAQAQSRRYAPADALAQVTFEDVAVNFSAEEWSMLEGWQKELHKEVMLENYALLLSLGHCVPSVEFSSLICPLEGTATGWNLGQVGKLPSAGGEDNASGGRPPYSEDEEGPWDLLDMNDKEEGCLTPTGDGDGERQSSLHLCALMRLVKEIPEFLYGHTKANADPATPAGGCEAEGAAEVPNGSVKAAARMESPHHLCLPGDLADVSLSLSSRPDTPASSTEEEWVVSHIRDVATNTEVTAEEDMPQGLLKCEKEALLNRPCQSRVVQNSSLQTGMEAEACTASAAEGAGDPGQLSLPNPWKKGEAGLDESLGTWGSVSSSSSWSTGEKTAPEAAGRRARQEGASEYSPPNLARETTVEEKPLQGLLKCLKELIVHQPRRSHPAPRKQAPGRRRREVGSGSPPIQVKIEAAEEETPVQSPGNVETQGSSPHCTSNSQTEGDRRMNTPGMKDGSLFVTVKIEPMTSSPAPQYPDRASNSVSPLGAAGKERSAGETHALGVRVKTEPVAEEDPPLRRGLKEAPEEQPQPRPRLPKRGFSCLSPEAGMELWAPYPEEWSPATSPLHGLLNCLKDIPVPRPHASRLLPGKRAAAAAGGGGGGGGKERRKGGRRGSLELRGEWAAAEKMGQVSSRCQTPPVLAICGAGGNTLPGLERCLKEFPPTAQSQPCSPAVSSSIGSSPDRLSRWTPERGKWTRKEEGPGRNGTPLRGPERCLKELPLGSHGQPSSPAVSSSEGLHRWTLEAAGRWARKEEGRSRNSTPLQGLERCLKELPPNGNSSQPCSPALSSSISSSPDGLHRWTPEPGRWARKEEGLSRNSTPLQGSERSPRELPGIVASRFFLPAVSSSVGSSSSDRRCKPDRAGWSEKEEGESSSGIPPLQGLENCLKEIPVSGNPLPNSVAAASSVCAQKLGRTEVVSQRPWAAGGSTDGLLQCPPSISMNTEDGVESSPLHRLMNCLKEIPIRRPSYLNTPSVSSSSSSCSETDMDQQSPGGGAWWDCSHDTCQGSEADEVVGQKGVQSGRSRSPLPCLPSEEGRGLPSAPEPQLVEVGNQKQEPSTSPLRGLENCLKDIAASRLPCCSSIPPANGKPRRDVTPGESEVAIARLHLATRRKAAAGSPHLQGTANNLPASSPHPSKSLPSDAPRGASGQREWHAQTGASSAEGEGLTESSPLQGLFRCLKEITARGPSPCSSSAANAQGESRRDPVEEEPDARRASWEGLKERPTSTTPSSSPQREAVKRSPPAEVGGGPGGAALGTGATPTSTPVWGVGSCPKGNGPVCVLSRRPPALRFGALRRSDPSSPKSGMKRALATARGDDSLVPGAVSRSFKSRDDVESGNLPKKRCPSLDPSSPLFSWGNGKPPDCRAELGDLGPVLSVKLERLSVDMTAICRDVSRLQSHMDRLEQDARSWVLELAALRMENRSLSEYVRRMEGRCRTLENRSRRNNLRLLGLPEGVEGSDAISFLQRTLPAMLGLAPDAPPLEIESARRVHGGVSWDAKGRPRPLVIRLLRFADKAAILQAARGHPLSYASAQITILPDFYSSLSQRRRASFRTFRRTRWVADLCFGARHSACCYGWTPGLRPPLANPGPLAAEKDGRVSKRPGTGNWDTDPLPGPGHRGDAVLQGAVSNTSRDAALQQN